MTENKYKPGKSEIFIPSPYKHGHYDDKKDDGFWIEFNYLGNMETIIVVKKDGKEYRQSMDDFIANSQKAK